MAKTFYFLFDDILFLIFKNRLRTDIDDTLLQKLWTLLKEYSLRDPNECADILVGTEDNSWRKSFDFADELLSRTKVLSVVARVLLPSDVHYNYSIDIKAFCIRLLGLIYSNIKQFIVYKKLVPFFKSSDGNIIVDHPPSIQDALFDFLSYITNEFEGAMWFIDENLIDFVFSSFNSSSYYVRKSSVNFIIGFISQWMNFTIYYLETKRLEENYLENILKNFIVYIVHHIHFYKDTKEIVFAQCCISVMKHLLALQNIESLIDDHLDFSKYISKCFMDLAEDAEFNSKLTDLFLDIHFKFSLPAENMNDVIKCLIIKGEIKLAFDLTSSFISMEKSKSCCPDQLMFFLLPLHILMNVPLASCDNFFTVKADLVYNIMSEKMEDKSECKTLVSLSLCALRKVIPQMKSDSQKIVGRELLEIAKSSDQVHHKWFYSVLEDRFVHHAFTDLYSSLVSEEVYYALRTDGADLVFQNILEFLKKPTSDCRFLAQLLMLMRDVLVFNEISLVNIEESEKSSLIQVLCKALHDNRELIVDSALHLAGQMIVIRGFQNGISEKGIHSIVWDMAIQGNHDGTIRSTALKVIIKCCLKTWCLREMKTLKGITENDVVKILFDLTFDPDFFLQREALSCLFQWMKSKWNYLQQSSKEYLLSALVIAIKSLDLEQKLLSLDVWLWLFENKFTFYSISPSFDFKKYIEYLASSGFGLSMMLAIGDYDLAVQFKAAFILSKLQDTLKCRHISFDSFKISSCDVKGSQKCDSSEYLAEPITKEEKDKGIDNVMEISTTDQITNICHPGIPELYDFKQEYFSSGNEERKCSVSSFWVCLWSENITSILKPSTMREDIIKYSASLLSDVISCRIMDDDADEDTPDCY